MANSQIFFIRTAPYNYVIKGKSLFESFDLVAKNIFEPRIIDATIPLTLPKPDVIFCSTLRRSVETAKLIKAAINPNASIQITKLLAEIKYSMREFMTEEEFDPENISAARIKFLRAFNKNKLYEKKEEVKKRIDELLKLVGQEKGVVLCCSHGFLMKIIQSYIEDRSVFEKPASLTKLFRPNNIPFKFLEFFEGCGKNE